MDKNIAEEWLSWMRSIHIPEVMQTGCFTHFKILKILTNVEDDHGINFSIQYHCESLEKYHQYKNQFAPSLQQKTAEKYGESILAFRTLLEVIDPI